MTTDQKRRETSAKPAVGRHIEQAGEPLDQQCFRGGCTQQVYHLSGETKKCLHGHLQIPPHARSTADESDADQQQSESNPERGDRPGLDEAKTRRQEIVS